MKILASALFFGLLGAALAQSHLAISQADHPVGFATVSQRIEKDGSKVVETRMEIKTAKGPIRLASRSTYDAKGLPVRRYQQSIAPGGSVRQVVATFNAEGASVVLLEGDKRSVKTVSLAAIAPRANLAEFWFLRDPPAKAAVVESYLFNLDSLEWELSSSEYVGDREVVANGRTVKVHEVLLKQGAKRITALLDDGGLPVLIRSGDVKMERIWPK